MKLNLKRAFLPSLMAASLASVSLVPIQPAAADDRVIEDLAIGAGAGVVTGVFTRCGSVLDNAVKGGAAGAAVNGANGLRRNRRNRSVVQDLAVGAGASTLTGVITGGCRRPLNNAINGAAAGAAVNVYRNNIRRRR
ncbi:hypothetical protein [Nostoc sp. TCL26-01]|uniref:hypothetical protein n=1 Tax=Nostoc sp. TCL26-01 TaxID=2576904 RepID=UPI0015B94032|nr:hypothetical protein [Nostoc sp. TCL26-01]QLE57194.1 hypothetical protein FD725_17695 [Nostoc sp. TCL26-01]